LHGTGTPAVYVTHDQEEAFAIADRLLILEAGNFLQNGSPEEVYKNPASIAVAKFFGLTNLIEGKVIVVNSRPVVQTAISDFYLENDARKNIDPTPNEIVTLVLRKARIISDKTPGINNSFSAVVEDTVFKEEGFKTTILVNGIRMDFLLDQRCAKGEMIQLVIEPSDISVLQEK
jgi:ABC-type Fe3+/spermidine/putrescine transport system ATPase subunit